MNQVDSEKNQVIDTTAEFYDRLSADYDIMTHFAKRFVHEKPFFNMLVQKYGIETALDAGCGTGFHSLLLGELGVKVTAVDVSKQMLEHLKIHAREAHAKIELLESSFQELPDRLHRTFDAVFCLGNSLPHLLTQHELIQSLKNFSSALNPGGLLLLQQLNYDRILAKKERIQSVKEADGVTFIRFYEFHKASVVFNILTLKKENGQTRHELESTSLRPILKGDLLNALKAAGFSDIRLHGSIALDDYRELESKDLVVLARVPDAKS